MNIIEKKEYPLLSRTEIIAEESYTGATPSRETIKKILADKLNARNELIVIKHIYPEFGFGNARIIAHLYSNKKDMERIEPEYAFNKGILREKKEEKKQDKPKADEKKEEVKAEQDKGKPEGKKPEQNKEEKKEEPSEQKKPKQNEETKEAKKEGTKPEQEQQENKDTKELKPKQKPKNKD